MSKAVHFIPVGRIGCLKRWTALALAGCVVVGAIATDVAEDETSASSALEKAEKLIQEQNWAEALAAYDEARDTTDDWRSATMRAAVQGAVSCELRLQKWDDALKRAEEFVKKTEGSFEETIGDPLAWFRTHKVAQ